MQGFNLYNCLIYNILFLMGELFVKVIFDQIDSTYVNKFFPKFFHEDGVFFEIISNCMPIGFYGVRNVTDKICEISLYLSKDGGRKATKSVALKCLDFPFLLKFDKIIIRTELHKMHRFLCKMTKYGVKYLFKHNEFYWFEVSK